MHETPSPTKPQWTTKELNEVYRNFRLKFTGSFHTALWQIMINGLLEGKECCFCSNIISGIGYELGIAIKDERGYFPTGAFFAGITYDECLSVLHDLNVEVFGLDGLSQLNLITSTHKR